MTLDREASGERRFAAAGWGHEGDGAVRHLDCAAVEHKLAELTEREGQDLVQIEMLDRRIWYVRRW